jgi:hypothetical protein
MRDTAELVALANENFVASFAKLADHCAGGEHRRFGSVFAYVTRLPIALFNGCVVAERAEPSALDAALRWVAGHGAPMRLFLAPGLDAELEEVAAARGLERKSRPYPGMVLHPVPEPLFPAADIAVARVDGARLAEFRGVGVAGGMDPGLAERTFPASLFDDDVEGFVARLDGRAAGYSLAIKARTRPASTTSGPCRTLGAVESAPP